MTLALFAVPLAALCIALMIHGLWFDKEHG